MVVKPEDPPTLNVMEKKKRKSLGGGSGEESTKKVRSQMVEGRKEGSITRGDVGAMQSGTKSLLEGMSNAEVTMIRRLAGNDASVRKKTMRKLRKWLTTMVLSFPDSAGTYLGSCGGLGSIKYKFNLQFLSTDSTAEVEPNIIRVWKALFYCMWMADKPLPQVINMFINLNTIMVVP